MNQLNSLHYLELVIKETLRLFPSVPLVGRQLKEETTISKFKTLINIYIITLIFVSDNYTYPADTSIIVPIYFIGHSADIFKDPEEFRPERFDVEQNSEQLNPFAYIPFSAGPRNCIGQKFAMLEMKSLLSKVLRHYKITLADDSHKYPDLIAELILVPDSKIHFHLEPRAYK